MTERMPGDSIAVAKDRSMTWSSAYQTLFWLRQLANNGCCEHRDPGHGKGDQEGIHIVDMTYVNKRLQQVIDGIGAAGLTVETVTSRSSIPEHADQFTLIFNIRVLEGGSRYGVTMLGHGIMVIRDYSGDTPVILRRMTSPTQAIDILLALTHNNLFVHLEGNKAA